jgi:PEP-CTERM motif
MRLRTLGWLANGGLAVTFSLCASAAQASTFDVTVNTAVLPRDQQVLFVFDFTDGGLPDNTAKLLNLTQAGQIPPATLIGNVSQDTDFGPWTFSDSPPSLFNELQVAFMPVGSLVTFSFTTSDNPPPSGGTPDGFSFFILDADLDFLVTTNDPSNALFLYNIVGPGSDGLNVFVPDQEGFSFAVTPARSVPEPTSLALLVAGLLGLSARRRRSS